MQHNTNKGFLLKDIRSHCTGLKIIHFTLKLEVSSSIVGLFAVGSISYIIEIQQYNIQYTMDQQVQVQDDEADYSDRDADCRQSTTEEGIGSSNSGCNGQRARDKFSKLFFVRQVVFGGQNSGRHLHGNNKPHTNKVSAKLLSSAGGGGLRRQTSSVPKELDSTPAPQGGGGSPARRMSNAVFSSFTSAATLSSTGSSKAGDNNNKTKEALRKSQQGHNPFSFF